MISHAVSYAPSAPVVSGSLALAGNSVPQLSLYEGTAPRMKPAQEAPSPRTRTQETIAPSVFWHFLIGTAGFFALMGKLALLV